MRIGFELEFRSSDRCDRTRYIWEDSSKHPVGCGQGITATGVIFTHLVNDSVWCLWIENIKSNIHAAIRRCLLPGT